MPNDVPWLDLPQIGNVVDWLTNDQFAWFAAGCLIVNGKVVPDVLHSLFNCPMVQTTEDDGSLWTCYGYEIPGTYDKGETFRYFVGSHRHPGHLPCREHRIQPGDLILCHRKLTYNPGPVRTYERTYTAENQIKTSTCSQ